MSQYPFVVRSDYRKYKKLCCLESSLCFWISPPFQHGVDGRKIIQKIMSKVSISCSAMVFACTQNKFNILNSKIENCINIHSHPYRNRFQVFLDPFKFAGSLCSWNQIDRNHDVAKSVPSYRDQKLNVKCQVPDSTGLRNSF